MSYLTSQLLFWFIIGNVAAIVFDGILLFFWMYLQGRGWPYLSARVYKVILVNTYVILLGMLPFTIQNLLFLVPFGTIMFFILYILYLWIVFKNLMEPVMEL